MSSECRLLRVLLEQVGGAHGANSIPPMLDEVDWPACAKLFEHHGLAPLFYKELKDSPWREYFPPRIWTSLEGAYHARLRDSVLNEKLLARALEILQREKIEHIILKGGHLAGEYYGDSALRPMEDIDILIRPGDGGRLARALVDAGSRILGETATARRFGVPSGCGGHELVLEAHTDLQTPERRNPSFAIDIDDFWRSLRPSHVAGVPVRVLCPTINLLYLSAHFSHHGYSRLIWAYDLHLLVVQSGDEIEWGELSERCRWYRCASQVYYGLLFAREFFGSPIDGDALSALAPARIKRFLARPFLNSGKVLQGGLPVSGKGGLLQRFLLNDSWALAIRSY